MDRIKLSQILSHPFMTDQSHPQPSQLHQHKTNLMKGGLAPSSLTSLDSGHFTQCTVSSSNNNTLPGNRGPLKATLKLKEVQQNVPHTVTSISSDTPSVIEKKTSGSLRELVPPLNGARLLPIQLSSKNPIVSFISRIKRDMLTYSLLVV